MLWVGRHRRVKTVFKFFRGFGKQWSRELRFVCSYMWKPYVKVIKKKAENAIHLLDRYHIVANLNKGIDKVWAQEARPHKQEGYEPVLKHTRWCFLKREKNLTDKQRIKLKDILRYDLKSVRAYLLKEAFQLFWNYKSPYWAGCYLDKWVMRAMRSRLEPVKEEPNFFLNHLLKNISPILTEPSFETIPFSAGTL